jgi:hypothetical protein
VTYVAVLDADVLHPHISVDVLLRLAERRLFRPAWSVEILGEVRESLIRRELDAARVDRRLQAMHDAFPEAMTDQVERFLSVVPDEVDEGDRHVAAAALAARADAIVTRNISDFAPTELFALGIGPADRNEAPSSPAEERGLDVHARPERRDPLRGIARNAAPTTTQTTARTRAEVAKSTSASS